MQNKTISDHERLQGAVLSAAIGSLEALRMSSTHIPDVLLDATVTLGRVAFETLSAVAQENTEVIRTTMCGIANELDRLDRERVESLCWEVQDDA